MLVQTCRNPGRVGAKIGFLLTSGEKWCGDERYLFIENCIVAGARDVLGGNAWQPKKIVRKLRAQSVTGVWVPPMQYIAFDKLLTRVAKNLCSCNIRPVA